MNVDLRGYFIYAVSHALLVKKKLFFLKNFVNFFFSKKQKEFRESLLVDNIGVLLDAMISVTSEKSLQLPVLIL